MKKKIDNIVNKLINKEITKKQAKEMLLSLHGVIVTCCPECGSYDLDRFEAVVSCNAVLCNWYLGKHYL